MALLLVGGARPNFMKLASLYQAGMYNFDIKILHTGQHYDYEMSQVFFDTLGLPEPDWFLGVGGGSHANQTARIMDGVEAVLNDIKPEMMVVVGDVNSTLAATITAKKMNIPVAHVEAGLRSGDKRMPEEINRIAVDSISDMLFCSEPAGYKTLESVEPWQRTMLVGDTMIDTLIRFLDDGDEHDVADALLKRHTGDYAYLTLHRPSNVDVQTELEQIMATVAAISEQMPIIFPVHPRTRKRLAQWQVRIGVNVYPTDPVPYKDSLELMRNAALILTDSGGIQNEAMYFRVPCVTIRENTERPITVDCGCNEVVGTRPEDILAGAERAFKKSGQLDYPMPWFLDGEAGVRIMRLIEEEI